MCWQTDRHDLSTMFCKKYIKTYVLHEPKTGGETKCSEIGYGPIKGKKIIWLLHVSILQGVDFSRSEWDTKCLPIKGVAVSLLRHCNYNLHEVKIKLKYENEQFISKEQFFYDDGRGRPLRHFNFLILFLIHFLDFILAHFSYHFKV